MVLGRDNIVLLLSILTIGCVWPSEYRGDGDLSDSGPTAATDRYLLDLGPAEDGTNSYTLKGLPSVEFTVGLRVDDLGLEEADAVLRQYGAQVHLTLTTADGEVVFDQAGTLADWVLTSGIHGHPDAFAYRHGDHREVPQPDGDIQVQRVGVGVDGGWGTYFKPQRDEVYRLEVTISSATDLFASHTIRLLARGGGWK